MIRINKIYSNNNYNLLRKIILPGQDGTKYVYLNCNSKYYMVDGNGLSVDLERCIVDNGFEYTLTDGQSYEYLLCFNKECWNFARGDVEYHHTNLFNNHDECNIVKLSIGEFIIKELLE